MTNKAAVGKTEIFLHAQYQYFISNEEIYENP